VLFAVAAGLIEFLVRGVGRILTSDRAELIADEALCERATIQNYSHRAERAPHARIREAQVSDDLTIRSPGSQQPDTLHASL
jgi:hypothetical protein